jgi:L-threonylcarbamoyladenylate synthase
MLLKIGKDLDLAYRLLRQGEVVGIPTETVYGLAANAFDELALARIFELKQRPRFDPLIVHCANKESAFDLAYDVPTALAVLAEAFWPGPLTILVNKKAQIPHLVTAGLPTVALRVPALSLTLDLLHALDFPLAAPSANPFGYVSPTSAFHVLKHFGDKIPYILDGEDCRLGLESTIVRWNGAGVEVLRLGSISMEALQDATQDKVLLASGLAENSPGNFKQHYSNHKEMVLLAHGSPMPTLSAGEASLCFNKVGNMGKDMYFLTENDDLSLAASRLFGLLRQLDRSDIHRIYAELAPGQGLGLAINDRLKRAAG